MTYYVKSIVDYISHQMDFFKVSKNGSRRLLIMIPQLSGDATRRLTQILENVCFDNGIELIFKVANELIQTWPHELAQALSEKYKATGNLTGDRNSIDNSEPVVQILVGSAKVTDKSSLADFHQCDASVLWKTQLQSSFRGWSKICFEKVHISYEAIDLDYLDIILKELRERYDLFQISQLLDETSFIAQDGRFAIRELLAGLERFMLPNLRSFKFNQKRRTFRYYVNLAYEFFRYEVFMDEVKRTKAINNLNAFVDAKGGSIPPEKYDPFTDEVLFLAALRDYIENNSQCADLQRCDFIYIVDDILKFIPKRDKPDRLTVKKLAGTPVEVLLHALWLALSKHENRQVISKITLTGQRFRHDYMTADGTGTTADNNEIARTALGRLLGGIDALCTRYIQLSPYGDSQEIPIESTLMNPDLSYIASKTAEPYFEFHVILEYMSMDPERYAYAWKLPETHPYRLADGLIALTARGYEHAQGTWMLPAYQLTYYQELMVAKDEDEIMRVLLQCINECRPGSDIFMVNLFLDIWQKENDPFAPYLQEVCSTYRSFIETSYTDGVHAALNLGGTVPIFLSYRKAAEAFTKNEPAVKGSIKMASMLMRAFLILSDKSMKDKTKWAVLRYEASGVVTILHPALLEMLQSQVAFLFSAFSTVATMEFSVNKGFNESKWQYYADLASIKMPLAGLLVDENLKLDVNIIGNDLIHRVGRFSIEDTPMTTRLLVRYDAIDDDDVSDTEIFHITRESKLLFRFMKDYWIMHPQANDGISICVYRNDDIQPILSSIHNYLQYLEKKGVLSDDRLHKYYVKLVLFSESTDEIAIVNWLEQWQERWEAAEIESGLSCYSYCQFSISHRIVSSAKEYKQLLVTLKQEIDCDIFILYDFIEAGRTGNQFKVTDEFNETIETLKFPILEKSLCASAQPDERTRRAQVISNRQFRIGALHTEIMARLKNENTKQGDEHIIIGYGDYEPWCKVIDATHSIAEWVICIDASIDEKLIAYSEENIRRRELIGFGSGVGSHGESNYTISTQKFFLEDIKRTLLESFKRIYKYGTLIDDTMITESLMHSARSLAGLSLIRALGPSEYVRDFISYALMQKLLPHSEHFICDQLFSIDAYQHWFDMSHEEDMSHPDLLWLRVELLPERRLRIEAKLFECKMAEESLEHIDKAKTQIINGINVLATAFMQKSSVVSDRRPDQRYWYLQLHRLIASRAHIEATQEKDFLSAMESLAEGDFEITWDAAIFTFWTDTLKDGLSQNDSFSFIWKGKTFQVPIYSAGYRFIRDICVGIVLPLSEWSDNLSLVPQAGETSVPPEREQVNADTGVQEEEDMSLPIQGEDEHDIVPLPIPNLGSFVEPTVENTGNSNRTEHVSNLQLIPKRVLLGRSTIGQRDVYWEFGHKDLNNRHMLIFGSSGMGKTYAIQAILCELGRYGQNSLIVDYTNGFLNRQLQEITKEALKPVQHILKTEKLPISPFKKQAQEIDEGIFITDTDIDVAKRVSATFKTVYELGDHQFSILTDAIAQGVRQYQDGLTLDHMMAILHSYLDDGIHPKASVLTTISRMKNFVSEKPFATEANGIGWQNLFTDVSKKCHVFQLTQIDRISQKILTEFILWDLYAYVRSSGNEALPKVVVLDEVQNLDHGLDAPVAKYLTEGRKFGIALIAATQTLSNLEKEEQARMFLAAHKLFFRPTDPEMSQYAEYTRQAAASGDKNDWMMKLSALQKGECLSIGPMINESTGKLINRVERIKITSLEERELIDG